MSKNKTTRRSMLKKMVAMTAMGAAATLSSGSVLARAVTDRFYSTKIPGVTGKVIAKYDSNYELWRRAMIWHHYKPKRFPDLIVQAQSKSDVIAAVKYAAENNLKVGMRASGHNSTGTSLRQGGMVIDLSAMRDLTIDAEKQVASIQPGVRSMALTLAAGKEGLFYPVPHCPSVCVGGFSMGGGIGWNGPQLGGMSTHSIIGAEVVTADGRVLNVNATEHPDLYWAIRGAGAGFFGVVTRLDLQLYPEAKSVMASSYIFPLDDVEVVTGTLAKIRAEHDISRLEMVAVLMHHPEAPADAPPEESKICFFTAFAFEDSEDKSRELLGHFANSDFGDKSKVKMEYQRFTTVEMYDRYFSLRDPAGRQGRYKVDNILTDNGNEALLAMVDHFRNAPSKDAHVLASFGAGFKTREDSCFSWNADTYFGCYTIWDDPEEDAKNFEWLEQTLPIMDPFAVGHYANEVDARHADRYRKCYTDENWKRLGELRAKYDPDGVFRTYLTQDEAMYRV